MGPGWLGTLRFAVIATSVGLFMAGAHLAATALMDSQRARQISEITDVALRRAEVAIDSSLVALDELVSKQPISCDPDALQVLRLDIYQRWSIKDIRIANRDGSVACSAYPETLEFDLHWAARDDMLPARDASVRLFRVEQLFGAALGVFRDINDSKAIVAILTINASLLDMMPRELRDHSKVALELSSGRTVAQYSMMEPEEDAEAPVQFSGASARYPLRAIIRVEAAAYHGWHREAYVPIMLLGVVLGLGFGGLLSTAVGRPRSPIAEIDRGLAANEFQPYLQPVFDLRTNRIVGCEVLARWIRSDGTVEPPARFIPLAESSGRIEAMTWQLMTSALTQLRDHMAQDKSFKVSINIVPRHLTSPGFIEDVRRIVADARVSPRQIVLEITERDALPDLKHAAGIVAQLRDHGFKVAIDDVGIGHSGLSHIQMLAPSTLKIDKFFIDSVTRDPSAVTVIDMLVRLAAELKMTVIAEGIETAEQIGALIDCGISEGQGFVFSKPLPVPDFIAFVAARRNVVQAIRPARVA